MATKIWFLVIISVHSAQLSFFSHIWNKEQKIAYEYLTYFIFQYILIQLSMICGSFLLSCPNWSFSCFESDSLNLFSLQVW